MGTVKIRSDGNNRTGRREIERILHIIKAKDAQAGLEMLQTVFGSGKHYESAGGLISLLKDPSVSHELKSIALFIHRSWRVWSGSSLVDSVAAHKDLAWLQARLNDLEQLGGVGAVEEPISDPTAPPSGREGIKETTVLIPEVTNGRFIQLVYELILARGCKAWEIAYWEQELAAGRITREAVLKTVFTDHASATLAGPPEAQPPSKLDDAALCHLMGTDQCVTLNDWKKKVQELKTEAEQSGNEPGFHSRFYIQREPALLVTAIASLYRGGRFIDQFMENITSQTCFHDYCELVIIDADSPENESEVIERFCKQYKNIVYRRMNYRIGVYEAWNIGVKLARGEYLTNTNVDDIRRSDSLELQAAVLDNLSFVDIVYQDFFYTFDPHLRFNEIARLGFKSELPVVTPNNMMDFNSPHNAPMWRKQLHEDLGYFDVSYRSAGDYEFWMRCLTANRVFYKINDPHLAYYHNPEGVSTRPDSQSAEESRRILKTYGRRLVSKNVFTPITQFAKQVGLRSTGETRANGSRYACVQQALRNAAIGNKWLSRDDTESSHEVAH